MFCDITQSEILLFLHVAKPPQVKLLRRVENATCILLSSEIGKVISGRVLDSLHPRLLNSLLFARFSMCYDELAVMGNGDEVQVTLKIFDVSQLQSRHYCCHWILAVRSLQ